MANKVNVVVILTDLRCRALYSLRANAQWHAWQRRVSAGVVAEVRAGVCASTIECAIRVVGDVTTLNCFRIVFADLGYKALNFEVDDL